MLHDFDQATFFWDNRPCKTMGGLFFRPMHRKCVEKTAAGKWKQFFMGSSLSSNENAASKNLVPGCLGLNPLFFRCENQM